MCDLDIIWAEVDAMEPPKKPVAIKPDPYYCTCGVPKILNEDCFLTCTKCGLVDEFFISDEPEWISSVSEAGVVNETARCGMPTDTDLFSEQWGASTSMATRGFSKQHKRLGVINFHNSMNHKDRSLFHAYKDIDTAGKDNLNLPDSVLRTAKIIYRKFNQEKLTRGAVRTGIKANCVIYACKMANVPRTTKEVATAFGIPTKDISRTSEIFKSELQQEKNTKKSEVTRPSDVIPRLLSEFTLENKRNYTMKCMKIASKIENCVTLMGKTPNSIAVAIICFVLKDNYSKTEVCQKTNVSVPTVNKIDTMINQYLEGKIP